MNKTIRRSNLVARLLTFFIVIIYNTSTSASTQFTATDTKLTIATAANFRATLNQLLVEFKKQRPTTVTINVISGSTGSLYQQIVSGAPFDVFFAADNQRPQALIKHNLTSPSLVFPYARGELVLAVKPVAAQAVGFQCGDSLTTTELVNNTLKLFNNSNKIVIANPRIAPYGIAAQEFINTVYGKLSNGHSLTTAKAKNVIHAQQLFENTSTAIAIISKSQALTSTKKLSNTKGFIYCPIPSHLHSAIIQTAAIITHANSSAASIKTALALKDFLHSKTAMHIIYKSGYFPVNKTNSLLTTPTTSSN